MMKLHPSSTLKKRLTKIPNCKEMQTVIIPKYLFAGFFFLMVSCLHAQNNSMFVNESVLEIDIYIDMQGLTEDIGEEREYHNGLLVYTDAADKKYKFDIKLRTRGNFRRKPDVCPFPPIKVNFEKDQIENSIFEGADKIKLVTHCNSNDRNAEDYLFSEYLAYKIFNQINNISHRVRLARIRYHDILEVYPDITRYAFFVEKDEQLAERTEMHCLDDIEKLSYKQLNMDYYQLFSVFQFLIGNTDWSVLLPKNITVLNKEDTSQVIVVPYDFDLSYLVKPSYITKNPGINPERNMAKIKSYCQSLDEFSSVIQFIAEKRNSILKLVQDFDLLDRRQKRHVLEVLKAQFDKLEDPESLDGYFEEICYD